MKARFVAGTLLSAREGAEMNRSEEFTIRDSDDNSVS